MECSDLGSKQICHLKYWRLHVENIWNLLLKLFWNGTHPTNFIITVWKWIPDPITLVWSKLSASTNTFPFLFHPGPSLDNCFPVLQGWQFQIVHKGNTLYHLERVFSAWLDVPLHSIFSAYPCHSDQSFCFIRTPLLYSIKCRDLFLHSHADGLRIWTVMNKVPVSTGVRAPRDQYCSAVCTTSMAVLVLSRDHQAHSRMEGLQKIRAALME